MKSLDTIGYTDYESAVLEYFTNNCTSTQVAELFKKEEKDDEVSKILLEQQEKYDRNLKNDYICERIIIKTVKIIQDL